MNILFMSQLYPVSKDHYAFEKVSDALHMFVRDWIKTENVMVIRPLVTSLNPFKVYKYDPSKIKPGELEMDGVIIGKVRSLRLPFFEIYEYNRVFRYISKKSFRPDVIVAHLNESIFIAERLARKFDCPLISGIHMSDLDFFKYPLAGWRLKRTLRKSTACACRSKPIRDRFIEQMPEMGSRCFTANSGIDPGIIIDLDQAIDRVRNWKNTGNISFVTVSYLEKRKKIDLNLYALASLPDDLDWKYLLVGDGEERQYLETLASDLGIADRVLFKGFVPREEALSFMEQSDVFIMVSDRETFGLAYLEAMAKGNIVIGACRWGVDGIIENGENGFLCEVDDVEALKRVLQVIVVKMPIKSLESMVTKSINDVKMYSCENASRNYLDNIRGNVK